jgi:hypothetical protein
MQSLICGDKIMERGNNWEMKNEKGKPTSSQINKIIIGTDKSSFQDIESTGLNQILKFAIKRISPFRIPSFQPSVLPARLSAMQSLFSFQSQAVVSSNKN